jgi:hypothetical protein
MSNSKKFKVSVSDWKFAFEKATVILSSLVKETIEYYADGLIIITLQDAEFPRRFLELFRDKNIKVDVLQTFDLITINDLARSDDYYFYEGMKIEKLSIEGESGEVSICNIVLTNR